MEILKTILSFLMQNSNYENFSPIYKLLEENSFDLKKTLTGLTPEVIAPIFMDVLKEKPTPQTFKTEPIKKIADEEIVATLNSYFENN